jgi:hypothetical protein
VFFLSQAPASQRAVCEAPHRWSASPAAIAPRVRSPGRDGARLSRAQTQRRAGRWRTTLPDGGPRSVVAVTAARRSVCDAGPRASHGPDTLTFDRTAVLRPRLGYCPQPASGQRHSHHRPGPLADRKPPCAEEPSADSGPRCQVRPLRQAAARPARAPPRANGTGVW